MLKRANLNTRLSGARQMLLARVGLVPLQLGATLVVSSILVLLFAVVENLVGSSAGWTSFDIRPAILCVSLLGFALVSYVVWPNRWNVLAHTQLAFGIVAYIIPILLLGGGRKVPSEVLGQYTAIMAGGYIAAVVGTVLGAWWARRRRVSGRIAQLSFPPARVEFAIPLLVKVIAVLACLGVIGSFIVMGFIPALASDPFAAKFLKGEYAESYSRVAILYRACTSALTVLVPLLTMYALWRRKPIWIVVFLASVTLLILTLQRGPAVSGVLLFIGLMVAMHKRGMLLYFFALLAVYFAGSASYFVFAALGIGNFGDVIDANPVGFLASVAAGAPDVSDQFLFFQAWLANPVYPHGLTFVGGLVPGNFEWNPAVWSLAVTYPGVDISTLNSGGFRLPAPLWGFVNFGWAGAIVVGAVYGLIVGFLTQGFVTLKDSGFSIAGGTRLIRRETIVLVFLVYATLLDFLTDFYALSYVALIQTVLMLAIILVGSRASWLERWSSGRSKLGGPPR